MQLEDKYADDAHPWTKQASFLGTKKSTYLFWWKLDSMKFATSLIETALFQRSLDANSAGQNDILALIASYIWTNIYGPHVFVSVSTSNSISKYKCYFESIEVLGDDLLPACFLLSDLTELHIFLCI